MNNTPKEKLLLKKDLKLSNLLKIASIVGGTSSLLSVLFLYSYLDMVGRSDVFLDVLGAMSAVGYILAIGVLFGMLALLSLLVPSYLLVLTHEEIKRYVAKTKHAMLARRLLYLTSGGMAVLIIAIFSVSFIETEGDEQLIKTGEIIGIMALIFIVVFLLSIINPMVKKRVKITKNSSYKLSWWSYFWFKFFNTIFMSMLSFTAFISAIFVSVIVLKLNQWGEGIWPMLFAMSLVMLNMQATLLPAFFYLLSEGWKAPQKWIGAVLGTFMFLAILIMSTPLIVDSLQFNVAKSISLNDVRAWVYHVDDKRIQGVFSGSKWWNQKDTKSKETNDESAEMANHYIVAKLLYGMGGVKLLCPRNINFEIKRLETWRGQTSACILVDSSAVTKIGLYH